LLRQLDRGTPQLVIRAINAGTGKGRFATSRVRPRCPLSEGPVINPSSITGKRLLNAKGGANESLNPLRGEPASLADQ
jgi:hypothetical protein